jgi:hypothetical protein
LSGRDAIPPLVEEVAGKQCCHRQVGARTGIDAPALQTAIEARQDLDVQFGQFRHVEALDEPPSFEPNPLRDDGTELRSM